MKREESVRVGFFPTETAADGHMGIFLDLETRLPSIQECYSTPTLYGMVCTNITVNILLMWIRSN